MRNFGTINRMLYQEANDGIILNGQSTGSPAANTVKTETAPVETFTEINDSTDSILKNVVVEKYSDLTTVKLNKNGDVVNTEGTILIKKEDVDKSVNEVKVARTTKANEYIAKLETVEVSGVEYSIAEDGSVKDTTGKILLTKEKLLEQIMSTDDYLVEDSGISDDDIYASANAITGLEFVDEKGSLIEFEQTPQGLAQRDIYIAKTEGARLAKQSINNFFSEYPDLEDAFYYYKTNGSLNGFGNLTNHEGVTIDKNNEDQQYNIFLEGEMKRGLSKELAIKRADLFKKNDMLFEEAESNLSFMVQLEKEEKDTIKTRYEQEQQASLEANNKYWESIKGKISAGKVLDYNIPENIRIQRPDGTIKYATRQDFFDYLRIPVENGLTKAQLDAKNEPIDLKLFYDYLRFVNNNMTYIIEQRVKDNKVQEFKNLFNKGSIPGRKLVVKDTTKTANNENIRL